MVSSSLSPPTPWSTNTVAGAYVAPTKRWALAIASGNLETGSRLLYTATSGSREGGSVPFKRESKYWRKGEKKWNAGSALRGSILWRLRPELIECKLTKFLDRSLARIVTREPAWARTISSHQLQYEKRLQSAPFHCVRNEEYYYADETLQDGVTLYMRPLDK